MQYMSVGDIVRDKLSNDISWFGEEYSQENYNRGELVPDHIISKKVIELLSKNPEVILDGFPRTENQCNDFIEVYNNNFILIDIFQEEEILIKRAVNRRICPKCGEIYSLINPQIMPSEKGTCLKCDSPVIQRKYDCEETIKNRINEYIVNYPKILNILFNNTKKGININTGEFTDINLIMNLLSQNIILSNKYDFKIVLQLMENL